MGTIDIRVAEADGAERVTTLVRRFHAESGRMLAEPQRQVLELLVSDGRVGRAWLAKDDERDVGCATALFCHSVDAGGRIALFDDVYVVPEHRGRGIGRALLTRVIDDCARLGLKAGEIKVELTNRTAVHLYGSLGFRARPTTVVALDFDQPVVVG